MVTENIESSITWTEALQRIINFRPLTVQHINGNWETLYVNSEKEECVGSQFFLVRNGVGEPMRAIFTHPDGRHTYFRDRLGFMENCTEAQYQDECKEMSYQFTASDKMVPTPYAGVLALLRNPNARLQCHQLFCDETATHVSVDLSHHEYGVSPNTAAYCFTHAPAIGSVHGKNYTLPIPEAIRIIRVQIALAALDYFIPNMDDGSRNMQEWGDYNTASAAYRLLLERSGITRMRREAELESMFKSKIH